MPADSDHVRRDALHAARSEVRIQISKYLRRLDAEAKAHIEDQLARRTGEIDGTELGREAARAAFGRYLGAGDVHETVEAAPRPELDR